MGERHRSPRRARQSRGRRTTARTSASGVESRGTSPSSKRAWPPRWAALFRCVDVVVMVAVVVRALTAAPGRGALVRTRSARPTLPAVPPPLEQGEGWLALKASGAQRQSLGMFAAMDSDVRTTITLG